MMSISKKFYEGFQSSIDIMIFEIIKEIYFFRFQSYDKLINRIPILYTHNIFSKFFLMLDDILNSNCKNNNEFGMSFYPFLSKEHLNNLKTLKIKNVNVHNIAKIFCIICDLKPFKKTNKTGDTVLNYIETVKSLALKNTLQKLMRNINKLYFNQKKVILIENELKNYCNIKKLNEVKNINHGIYQLLIWELFVLQYLKVYNVFDFLNIDYIKNLYNQQENESIKYYIGIMDYLKYHLKIKFHFSTQEKNMNPNFGFMKFLEKLINYLEEQNLTYNSELILKSTNNEWEKIGESYYESKDLIPFNSKCILYEKVMLKILFSSESESNLLNSMSTSNNNNFDKENINFNNNQGGDPNINNKNNINNNMYPLLKNNFINNNSNINNNDYNYNYPSLNGLPEDILIKTILFYLDINSLPVFSLVNHKFLSCVKTHIFIRIYFLNKEKQSIEEEHINQYNSISSKRKQFFSDYEMTEPTKDHAFNLMNLLTSDDILELKQCFRKYNKTYEKIIVPFLILLNEKPIVTIRPDGEKKISYYQTAKNVLFKPGFIRRIRNMELETLPYDIFRQVDQKLKEETFAPKNIQNLSPCFSKLILWVSGVIEFHKVIRKYSLSDYDYEILEQEEIEFCVEMDNIVLLYYKLLRYATKYCKNYENRARKIMREMNIFA